MVDDDGGYDVVCDCVEFVVLLLCGGVCGCYVFYGIDCLCGCWLFVGVDCYGCDDFGNGYGVGYWVVGVFCVGLCSVVCDGCCVDVCWGVVVYGVEGVLVDVLLVMVC